MYKIAEEPIPLIFKKILKNKMSGELNVKADKIEKKLVFLKGNLKYARSNAINERLGEILFKLGKISQTQFWNIHKMLEGKKDKIGKILVQKNIISQKDVFFALLHQMITIAISLFELEKGEWEFRERYPEIPPDTDFNVELPGIITEGIKKIINLAYYQDIFSEQSPVLSRIGSPPKEVLSENDQHFLRFLADFTDVPCAQILPKYGMPENIFWKKIILLYMLNIIDFKEIKHDPQESQNIQDLFAFYDRITENKTDYYGLLCINNTSGPAEIKDAYFALAKKFHPDRIANSSIPEVKEKANFVFAAINKAYDTLSHEEKKEKYDSQGYREPEKESLPEENLKEKARIFYLKAKTLYGKGQFWEAASLLDVAIKLDKNKPAFYLLLGLSQMNIVSLRKIAETNLQKAIEMEPWNAEPLTAMGMLFLSEGLNIRAENFFRKALAINPNHTLAKKKLTEMGKAPAKKISFGSFFTKKKT